MLRNSIRGSSPIFQRLGVKAIGERRLRVELENPTPYFLSLLQHHSSFPVHKKTVESYGEMDDRGNSWSKPDRIVSNGPFTLKSWEINKAVVVAKSDTYWGKESIRLKEVRFYPTENRLTEEKSFRAGQLHVTNEIPNSKIASYQKNGSPFLRLDPYLGIYYYRFNTKIKPFDNKDVRRALTYAIDRQQLVERVSRGGELPAWAFTPPGTGGYHPKRYLEYNLKKAQAFLAKAGFPKGKGFPKVQLLFNTSENHKIIAEAIQQMWKRNLGVEIELVNQDWKVYLASMTNLDYQMARAGWIGDYPDPHSFLDCFLTGGGNNRTGWSNKRYDELIARATRIRSRTDRMAIYQKAESILMDELPILPIYVYTKKYLLRPEVKGWYPNILDTHPFQGVYLEPQITDPNQVAGR